MKFLIWIKNLFSQKPKSGKVSKRPLTDEQFNDLRIKRQKKMDSILDKISKKGYDSLSIHEKNFLDNYGKN
jgi:hypothetical protein